MFTGIVQGLQPLVGVSDKPGLRRLTLSLGPVDNALAQNVELGMYVAATGAVWPGECCGRWRGPRFRPLPAGDMMRTFGVSVPWRMKPDFLPLTRTPSRAGASIAVNGVCLTVVTATEKEGEMVVDFDVMQVGVWSCVRVGGRFMPRF